MNRFLKMFAVAAAGFAVALLAPAQTWAACPGSVSFGQCLNAGGGMVLAPGTNAMGGTYWVVGQGNTAIGPGDLTAGFGTDAGQLAGFPIVLSPTPGESWLTDFVTADASAGYMCLNWDWFSFGSDGCADPLSSTAMAAVIRDNLGNFAIMQVRSDGNANYDFDTINNGGVGGLGGSGNGVNMDLHKAVRVTSASDLGTTVGVNVAPLNLLPGTTMYDDQGGARPLPGTVRLRGRQAGLDATLSSGPGGGAATVDADSNVCWELVDGAYTVTLGCQAIGGNTPSQNVVNGKAGFAKGGAAFTWDVTAQFDVLGFNIYQKNVSKGTDRKINDGLISLSGDNDATAESYKYVAPRSDLRAWKGGFEIELVRQNGETSRAPVTLTK